MSEAELQVMKKIWDLGGSASAAEIIGSLREERVNEFTVKKVLGRLKERHALEFEEIQGITKAKKTRQRPYLYKCHPQLTRKAWLYAQIEDFAFKNFERADPILIIEFILNNFNSDALDWEEIQELLNAAKSHGTPAASRDAKLSTHP